MKMLVIKEGYDPNILMESSLSSHLHNDNWHECGITEQWPSLFPVYWSVFLSAPWSTLTHGQWICMVNRWARDIGILED